MQFLLLLGSAGVTAAVMYAMYRLLPSPMALPDLHSGTLITATGYVQGQPRDLILESIGNRLYLTPQSAAAYRRMDRAASAAGVALTVRSAFRTKLQQLIRIEEGGILGAGGVAAKLGTSPHQRGVALDFDVGAGGKVEIPGTGPAWDWLLANAIKYGWRPHWLSGRFPREAWHFDFVGLPDTPMV